MGAGNDKTKIEETSTVCEEISPTRAEDVDFSPIALNKYNFDGKTQEETIKSIVSSYALMNQKIKKMKRTIRKSESGKVQGRQSPKIIVKKFEFHCAL